MGPQWMGRQWIGERWGDASACMRRSQVFALPPVDEMSVHRRQWKRRQWMGVSGREVSACGRVPVDGKLAHNVKG